VTAVLGGLGAALAWAAGTLCSARSTRMIGAPSVLALVMLAGLGITLPLVAAEGVPAGLDAAALSLLVVAGAGNVCGLLLAFTALTSGKVGVVAPIVSTEGAIAAVIAVAAGESIAPGTAVALAVVAAGVVLAARAADDGIPRHEAMRVPLLALAAAGCFGAGLYATGRVSDDLPLAWVLLPARLIGVLAVAVPLLVAGRLRLTREALPLVVAAGGLEVLGFAAFALGARQAIAVSAVLASQFAGVAALGAYLLLHERLGRIQVVGVATIAAGVVVVTALQA
jgi:drug/metabolite transporter (DMT)-like permease